MASANIGTVQVNVSIVSNENQLQKLLDYIDARIDEKIENAFGRDSIVEYLRVTKSREELLVAIKKEG